MLLVARVLPRTYRLRYQTPAKRAFHYILEMTTIRMPKRSFSSSPEVEEIKPVSPRTASKAKSTQKSTTPRKRTKVSPVPGPVPKTAAEEFGDEWLDWPAPRPAIKAAQEFIKDIAANKRKVLLVPDKDADGLSAGYVLHKTLELLGLPADHIYVHVLSKGTNVHSEAEVNAMERMVDENGIERVVVLDQGSRPGKIVGNLPDGGKALLLIDHHQSEEFPPDAVVLTACHTSPIATTSLLTYMTCLPLHSNVQEACDWAALMGYIGDLGTGTKWGQAPWPAHIAVCSRRYGGKTIADAVGAVNAPRRTAEYNVKKAWDILLAASEPKEVALNAWLKLCRLDVNDEIEKWARVPPRFSADGRVALLRVDSGFQIHPVIATRWAGTLRNAKTMLMTMCANTGFNPDPTKVSFSCRVSSGLRHLPDEERPNLIALLKEYGDSVEGFRERVGDDFARGHKEATGGIIHKDEFEKLIVAMGIDENAPRKKASESKSSAKAKSVDPNQKASVKDFFRVVPRDAEASGANESKIKDVKPST
ncbi:hypothetical protein FFLO_05659 [Filobasidium floriforme]|uniref:DDH domain-containing protein n=1 Tax=Filobasidium floriforme TaxID=5210 RepID=A0A8K0NL95_9TREE|nr:uncharacterized protein HD553DRAFT_134331 [Filobasidium floriforme]KAG7529431.1 hypothetical protein FFLO_05659 [Filobasidium floriforme]KAH8079307.1 hypothetical protein HD553DRAFT_134331 [Filobasidium floriforme]